MQNLFESLLKVQCELKAPKGQYNSFGKYKYRNCEDILEAVKPLLAKHGISMQINDDLVLIGDRYYIKATVRVFNGDDSLCNSAYAREEESKKGMDASQLTGSTSSYARKYALNGMFLIDDNKDADSMDNSDTKPSITPSNKDTLLKVMGDGNDIATAKYWRGLSQPKQESEWNTLDKDTQKALKKLLSEIK